MNMISLKFSKRLALVISSGIFLCVLGIIFMIFGPHLIVVITKNDQAKAEDNSSATSTVRDPISMAALIVPVEPVDTAAYDAKMLQLANLPSPKIVPGATTTTATIRKSGPWPVKTAPYPVPGALLPFNRIVAYYGNLYSKGMGVLGQYPEPQMLEMLASTTAKWAAADSATPVIPALDYIAVVAQGSAGADGKYRARMPASEIYKAIGMAAKVKGIVILDVQVGLSDVQSEIPLLAPYLRFPQIHLALDPEFAMHNGERPGRIIGTMDAKDVNYAAQYLAKIVRENDLPPKVLIVHRFTEEMVTNAKKISPLPEVQIVMDMDGFGFSAKKIGTYARVVVPDPVQFTGFKLFYKNDVVAGHMMNPSEVLKLSPQPSFIQYQ